ncbi:MAG: hypothetical protein D3908_06505 [Candidatus Electrothrix sp. AUS4]|nr:hypothetical protein [Candidatus Electrothrix sp. AUS4]
MCSCCTVRIWTFIRRLVDVALCEEQEKRRKFPPKRGGEGRGQVLELSARPEGDGPIFQQSFPHLQEVY